MKSYLEKKYWKGFTELAITLNDIADKIAGDNNFPSTGMNLMRTKWIPVGSQGPTIRFRGKIVFGSFWQHFTKVFEQYRINYINAVSSEHSRPRDEIQLKLSKFPTETTIEGRIFDFTFRTRRNALSLNHTIFSRQSTKNTLMARRQRLMYPDGNCTLCKQFGYEEKENFEHFNTCIFNDFYARTQLHVFVELLLWEWVVKDYQDLVLGLETDTQDNYHKMTNNMLRKTGENFFYSSYHRSLIFNRNRYNIARAGLPIADMNNLTKNFREKIWDGKTITERAADFMETWGLREEYDSKNNERYRQACGWVTNNTISMLHEKLNVECPKTVEKIATELNIIYMALLYRQYRNRCQHTHEWKKNNNMIVAKKYLMWISARKND
jgi:hypothetical protein